MQKVFGGLEFGVYSECHNDDVLSIDFYNGEISMVATGQRELKPTVHIWSPLDPSICYGSFQLPNACREVGCLAFDSKGQYIVAVGRDPMNTFFLFCIKTNSFIWTQETGENIIFEVDWNSTSDQICLVGNKVILFASPQFKKIQSVRFNNNKPNTDYYTNVSFSRKDKWIIGDSSGNLSLWKSSTLDNCINIGKGSIMALRTSSKHDFVCCSDSSGNAYLYEETSSSLKLLRKFTFGITIKGIDINSKGNLILGLKTGDIIYKEIMTTNNKKQKDLDQFYVTQSHFDGKISDICLIDNRSFLSVGTDNRIMLWNIEMKCCDKMALINEISEGELEDLSNQKIPSDFLKNQQGECIAYNELNSHVAIGVKNGTLSIRESPTNLDNKIITIPMPFNSECMILEYNPSGEFLASGNNDNKIYILSVRNNYKVHKTLSGLSSFSVELDWDTEGAFIQTVCENNDFLYFNVNNEEVVRDLTQVADLKWHTVTCRFGYYVQGVFLGNTDPGYINCVARSHNKKFMISGDDDKLLNLYNFPVISDSARCRSF